MKGWTIETLKEHYDTLLTERAKRAEERHAAAQLSIQAALAAADKAVLKSEEAVEKRFESVNEFRGALDDKSRLNMPRQEVELALAGLRERIDRLEHASTGIRSEHIGTKAGYVWAVGVVGLLATIVSIVAMILTLVS